MDSSDTLQLKSSAREGSSSLNVEYHPMFPEMGVRPWKGSVYIQHTPVAPGPKDDLPPLDGWTRLVHPSGRVYMYNEDRRVVMDGGRELLCNVLGGRTPVAELYTLVEDELRKQLTACLRDKNDTGDYELLLRIDTSRPTTTVSYYFVDWVRRSIFWVHKIDSQLPIASFWHLDDLRELHFWTHVDYYPMHHPLPSQAREELDAILTFQTIDAKTFKLTTAPWGPEDSHMLAKSLPDLSEPSLSRSPSRSMSIDSDITAACGPSRAISVYEGFANAGVARLWRQICVSRFQNFHGDTYARLARTDRRNESSASSVQPPQWQRTLLSHLLFNRPPRFYSELQDVFVDDIMYQVHWKAFVEEEVQPEWTNNGFMATVMLAANMAFLALSGVDDAAAGPLLSSKVLSLSSTIFATATLFTSLRLHAFHLKLKTATAEDAMKYMHQCSLKPLGLFGLAMLFSVPFVTFMWSLLTFIAAVLGFSFQHWTVDAGVPLITTTIVPVVGILVWMWWFFAHSSPGDEEADQAPDPPANDNPPGIFAKLRAVFTRSRGKCTSDSHSNMDVEKGSGPSGTRSSSSWYRASLRLSE